MDSTLLSRVNAYDSAFGAVLVARESFLHANKVSGQTNQQYTDAINSVAEKYLEWWEHDKRAAIANAYVNALAGYLTAFYTLPSLPDVLDIDCTPTALMDQGNYIGQFKAAVHGSYLDPSGPGGVLLLAWVALLDLQLDNETAELVRFSNALQARTHALLTMQSFDDVQFNEDFTRDQVRDRIFVTMGWTAFLKGPSGLHAQGVYAYPPASDFELAILPPLAIVEGPPDGYAIQYITSGMTPFYIRGAMLDTLFTANGAGNTISWGAGTAHFLTETNQYFSKAFSAGSFLYEGQTVYVAYNFLLDDLVATINPLTAYQSGQHVAAIYYGGFNLLVNGARQSIRGSDIIVNSMPPDRLTDGEMYADIVIGEDSDLILSGSNKRIQLGTDADPLMFIGEHTTDGFDYTPGYYFKTSEGMLFDNKTGLGANTVGSAQVKVGSIKEYHLDFGYRTVQEEGIVVSVDALNDTVFWSSGVVTWVDDLGNTLNTSILAGNAVYSGQAVFVLWEPGSDHFTTTTNPAVANEDNTYIFLQYSGGTNVVRNFNSTIIDGSRIRTNSVEANRIVANSIFTQTLYLGDDRFVLDGPEKRLFIKDEADVTRIYMGKESDDFVFKLFDKDGNLMIGSGATDSYGRVDDALNNITADVADINDTFLNIDQDIQDLYDLYQNIGDISADNFSAALIELQLFRGFKHIGALGDLVIQANVDDTPGKISVSGTYFDHPELGKIEPTLPVEFQIPWVNHLTPPGKWLIVVYSEQNSTARFGAAYGSGNFFFASYDNQTAQWKTYTQFSLVGQVFTPAATDLVCAVLSKNENFVGVDTVNSYVRETQVINARFNELVATIGDPDDPENPLGSIFARISNLDLVIANESEARSESILVLESTFEDAESNISQLFLTTADTDEALSQLSLTLNSRIAGAEADISENTITIADVDGALAAKITEYNARFDVNEDGLDDVIANLSTNYLTTANTGIAIANAQTTLRSEMSGIIPSFLRNPTFISYATTPGAPERWTSWGTPSSIARIPGTYSDNAVRITSTAGVSAGISQVVTGMTSGKLVMQFAASLNSGTYNGAGIYVQRTSDSAVVASYALALIEDTNGDISNSKTGVRNFRPVEIEYTSTNGSIIIYVAAHHPSLGTTAVANSIDFHQVVLSPSTSEISLISSLGADLSTNYYTKTQSDGIVSDAVAVVSEDLTAYIDGEVSDLNADLSLNYYTKTTTDGAISTAISAYDLSLRAYVDGQDDDVLSTLTTNYTTTSLMNDAISAATAEASLDLTTYIDGEVGEVAADLSTNYSTTSVMNSSIASSVSQAKTDLRSEIAGTFTGLLRNPVFLDYPTTPGAPTNWTSVGTPASITKQAGTLSLNSVRIVTTAGVAGGIYQTVSSLPTGRYFVEFATNLIAGSYTGAGIYIQRVSDSAVIASFPLATTPDTNGDTSSSKTGLRYFRPDSFSYTSTDGQIRVYLYAHSTAFGSIASTNSIDFHQTEVSPEEAAQKAARTVTADLSSNYSTTTVSNAYVASAISAYDLTMQSYVDGEVGPVISDLSLNYYTKTTVDLNVETAVSAAKTALRSEVTGSGAKLTKNSDFSVYSTTPGAPERWSVYNAATLTRVTGRFSDYAVRSTTGSNVQGGVQQQITGMLSGRYNVEYSSSINTGSYVGAGVLIQRNSDLATIAIYPFSSTPDTNGDTSTSKTGLRHFRPPDFAYTATDGIVNILLISHGSVFGAVTSANSIDFHLGNIVPASAAQKAANDVSSSLTTNYRTTALTDNFVSSAITDYDVTMKSYVSGEVGPVITDLSTNYSTTATSNQFVSDAIGAYDTTIRTYVDGETGDINTNLSENYYTRGSADTAIGSAVSQAKLDLRAEISGSFSGLLRNPTFVNYVTTPGAPVDWAATASTTLTRVTGKYSPYAVRVTGTAAGTRGLYQILSGVGTGRYFMQFSTAINTGTYTGAGVVIVRQSDSAVVASFPLATTPDINGDVSSTKTGIRHYRPDSFAHTATDGNLIIYLYAHNSTFGSIATANSIDFHQAEFSPEQSSQKAARDVSASLSNNYSTTTVSNQYVTDAIVAYDLTMKSYVDDEVGPVVSDLAVNYYTKTTVDDNISTAVASAKTELRSEISGSTDSLTRNPTFVNYTVTPGAPANWTTWNSPTLTRVVGKFSPNAVRVASGAGSAGGLYQQITGLASGKYFIEFSTSLVSGSYVASGVYIQRNSDFAAIASFPIVSTPDTNGDTSTSKTGLRYFRPPAFNYSATDGTINVYLMGHFSSYGSLTVANSIDFFEARLAPQTAGQKAAADVGATLTNSYYTKTTVDDNISTAVSAADLDLRSYIDGEVEDVLSTLDVNYYTQAETNDYVTSAISSANTTLRSEFSSTNETLNKNPTFLNYPTPTAAPTNWSTFGTPTYSRITGKYSPYGVRITSTAGGSAGILQQVTGLGTGRYYIEFTSLLNTGSYVGGGVLIQRNSDGATIASFPFASTPDTNGDTSTSKTGLRFFRPPDFAYTATDGIVNIYLMSHWSGFGSIASANAIDWFQGALKPLEAGQKAVNDVSASLNANYYTKTNVYTKSETNTQISDTIAGFDLSANTTFGALSSTVGIQGETISTLEDTSAILNIIAAASGGNPAIASFIAGIGGSAIRMAADKFSLQNTGTGGSVVTALEAVNGIVRILNKLTLGTNNEIEFDPSYPAIIFGFGATKLVLGKNFGVDSDLTFWFGPNIPLESMTKLGATFWFDNNGDAYFSGSFSAGTLSESVSNPAISYTSEAETASFGSNGGTIQIAYSLSLTGLFTSGIGHGLTTGTSNGVTVGYIDLYRSINGSAYLLVATKTLSGVWNYEVDPNDAFISFNLSGAGTYTDPVNNTQDRRYKVVLRNVNNGPYGTIGRVTSQRLSIVTSEN